MRNPFIRKLNALGPLSEAAIIELKAATEFPRSRAARYDLIREGDRPGPVFVVLEGWVCRYKILPNGGRQILAFLMPGDACDLNVGLLAEMDHGIQTISPALVATISRDTMDGIMDRHRSVERAMYLAQLVDEGTLRSWITSMGRRTSEERVAHLMCELYIRAKNVGLTTGDELEMPMSQALLADALGMTAVHINRVLRKLRGMEAMDLRRGHLTIKNPLLMINIAGFDENYLHRRLRQN